VIFSFSLSASTSLLVFDNLSVIKMRFSILSCCALLLAAPAALACTQSEIDTMCNTVGSFVDTNKAQIPGASAITKDFAGLASDCKDFAKIKSGLFLKSKDPCNDNGHFGLLVKHLVANAKGGSTVSLKGTIEKGGVAGWKAVQGVVATAKGPSFNPQSWGSKNGMLAATWSSVIGTDGKVL